MRILNAALREALASSDGVVALARFGIESAAGSPVELGRVLAEHTRRRGGIVKSIGFAGES